MKQFKFANVNIWGDLVGAVVWLDDRGFAVFEYDPSFLKRGLELSPIHMPLAEAKRGGNFYFPHTDPHTFHGLPGLLSSGLPDLWGNQIINSWLVRNGRDPHSFNPVERLCYVGSRAMGALEFEPQISSKKLNKKVPIEIENIVELAREVMTERAKVDVRIFGPDKEKAEAMLDILRVGTSAGGAVPKAIIAMNSDGHIISGQVDNIPNGYDHWILKFDGISEESPNDFGVSFENGRIEYAYYLMAKYAGINMTECRLLEENGRAHFMTRRFDRVNGEKIHMLSLACMAHFGWNPVGAHGYEDAFRIMRQLNLAYPDREQQYRRMVFNAMAKNQDDHTKNISFLMDTDGIWKLSPAYDILFTHSSLELFGDRHKMTINGKQKDFKGKDFLSVAESMEINRPKEIIHQIIDALAHWSRFASEAGMSRKIMEAVENMFFSTGSIISVKSDMIRRNYNM